VFVHGLWHGAWCWDEHFMPYLAERGHDCTAVSLRGHGASPGRERLRRIRVRDHVDDLVSVVADLPEPPVLIGHSMGGFVVQHYLEEQHAAAGAVLLASVPPSGAWRAALRTARRHPWAFTKVNAQLRLAPLVATPELARASLFSSSLPAAQVERYHRLLQDDSYLTFLDMLALDLVRAKRVRRVPMLVLGAAHDALFSPDEVLRTAAAYGADAEVVPGIAHDMMLDTDWEVVAERIARWLAERA
jgi:pimeloyl-ACP methyl ester carboxylesterase